jgi:excisionase family DNA binding protein
MVIHLERERKMNDQDQLLTVSEVAEILRCDQTTVRRWVKNGVFEAVSLPHAGKRQAYRIKRETLDRVLATSALAAVS